MTKNIKTLLSFLVIGGVGYFVYNEWKKRQPKKNFANYVDDDFFNYVDADFYNVGGKLTGQKESGIVQAGTRSGLDIGASGCEIVEGNVGYAGMSLSNNRVIVRTGNGTTLICPRGQRYDLPR